MPNCPTCHLAYPPGTEVCPRDGATLTGGAVEETGPDEARAAESRAAESIKVKLGSAPTIPERSPGLAGSTTLTAAQPQQSEQQFDSIIGTVLAGRYEVVRRIGEGGMGAVYEAKHALIGKRVAVKVLLEKFHAKSDFVARLLQEARLASSIGHQNIVDVTDFGTTDDGRSFVVMEFLDGESLADLERREAPRPI